MAPEYFAGVEPVRLTGSNAPALAGLAGYILQHRLEEFVRIQLAVQAEVQVPLLAQVQEQGAEAVFQQSLQRNRSLLEQLAAGAGKQAINDTLARWQRGQIAGVDRQEVRAEDIVKHTYARRQAFLALLPAYTEEVPQILAVCRELDRSLLDWEQAALEQLQAFEREALSRQTARLHESESRYRQAELVGGLGSWNWTVGAATVHWSDTMFLLHRLRKEDYPQNEVPRDAVYQYIHTDDLARIKSALEAGLDAGTPYAVQYRVRLEDGTERVLSSKAEFFRDEAGAIIRWLGTVQDVTERETLLTQVLESQRRHEQTQALAHVGSWHRALESEELAWSDETYRIHGLEPGTALTRGVMYAMIHPDDREDVFHRYIRTIRTGGVLDLRYRILRPDGTTRTLRSIAELERDGAGQPVRIIGSVQDITEAVGAERRIRESESFIRAITDATPAIITLFDLDTGRYEYVSEGLQQLLGYPPRVWLDSGIQFLIDRIHPDDRQAALERHASTVDDSRNHRGTSREPVYEFQYRLRHADGSYRWMHTFATAFERDDEGLVTRVLNISLDATEQFEAGRRLQQQEHFITHLVEASPTILYVFDLPSRSVQYINPEVVTVLGYRPEEVIRMGAASTPDIYHPDDLRLLAGRLRGADVPDHFQHESRMRTRDGAYRWMLVREVVSQRDADGRPLQLVAAAIDITARKEMEETVARNNALLQQSNASLEEFAYVASHDLQEPLRKVATFADMLTARNAGILDAASKMQLAKIAEAGRRMQGMIRDLLAVSVISSENAFERVGLQPLLEEVLQTLEHRLEETGARMEVQPLPEASVVPGQFRQLFQNLIGNALKFVTPGMVPLVRVSWKMLSDGEAAGKGLAGNRPWLQIEVADNGIGFDNQYAQKIFTVFQRLHGRAEYEGTGIGLAICKKVVKHHGGLIEAAGTPGAGATFRFVIPA